MALVPHYSVWLYDEYTKHLQTQAISDIMTIAPYEKFTGLGTYGLSSPCRALVWAVLKGMNWPLSIWSAQERVHIHDLNKPWFKPEAFRLETGSVLWPPIGRFVVLMPLSTGRASIDLIPRGTNCYIPAQWEPNTVIFLNETGIRFTGNGSLRFLYIMFHKSPLQPLVPPKRMQPLMPRRMQRRMQSLIPKSMQPRMPKKMQPRMSKKMQPRMSKKMQPSIPKKTQPSMPKWVQPRMPKKTQSSIPKEMQSSTPKNIQYRFLYYSAMSAYSA